jgi:hypothetical protein
MRWETRKHFDKYFVRGMGLTGRTVKRCTTCGHMRLDAPGCLIGLPPVAGFKRAGNDKRVIALCRGWIKDEREEEKRALDKILNNRY